MGKGLEEGLVRGTLAAPNVIGGNRQPLFKADIINTTNTESLLQCGVQEQVASESSESVHMLPPSLCQVSPYEQMTSPVSTYVPSPSSMQALSPNPTSVHNCELFYSSTTDKTPPKHFQITAQNEANKDYSKLSFENIDIDLADFILNANPKFDTFDEANDFTHSAQCSDQQSYRDTCNIQDQDIRRTMSPTHIQQFESLTIALESNQFGLNNNNNRHLNHTLPQNESVMVTSTGDGKQLMKKELFDDEYPRSILSQSRDDSRLTTMSHMSLMVNTPSDEYGLKTVSIETIEPAKEQYLGRRKRKGAMTEEEILKEITRENKKRKIEDMPTDERTKYLKRKQQNREAATRCRNKKKAESKITIENEKRMQQDNISLQSEIDRLNTEVAKLTNILACHQCVKYSAPVTHASPDYDLQPRVNR